MGTAESQAAAPQPHTQPIYRGCTAVSHSTNLFVRVPQWDPQRVHVSAGDVIGVSLTLTAAQANALAEHLLAAVASVAAPTEAGA